jgi:zinc/manganese transport system permease protein
VSAAGLGWNLDVDVHRLLQFHFMVNAFRAGTIVAVLAGAIGWFMVLRHQTFAGHTLAMVSFPSAAGAVLLGVSATAGSFVAPVVAALVIGLVRHPATPSGSSEESAVIGTVQAFALACGALFVSLYGGFLNGTTALLFGTFLGISDNQVIILLAVAAVVLVATGVMARPLFFATVDADVARSRGIPVRGVGMAFLVLLGCAAAEVSQITGVLLVFALLVMPAAAAQRLTARPGLSFAITIVLSLVITWLGLAVASSSVYPIGFFITTFGFAAFVLASAAAAALRRLTPMVRRRAPMVTRRAPVVMR